MIDKSISSPLNGERTSPSEDHVVEGHAPGRPGGEDQLQAAARFPDEPFPCPECGQLLGASARVCAVCKQPVDPAKIHRTKPAPAIVEAAVRAAPTARVPFPWLLFLGLLVALAVASHYGGVHFQAGVLVAEALTSVWVFYDASKKGIRRPLRWALGSLLLWLLVFPWYLAQRRWPRAECPFVEGKGLVITLAVIFLLGVVFVALRGPIK